MMTHKNERPFVCPNCGKDFTRQTEWKRHMELHDPNKGYKCAGRLADGRPWGCNKEFARKDALARHFRSAQVFINSRAVIDCREEYVLTRFFVRDVYWKNYMIVKEASKEPTIKETLDISWHRDILIVDKYLSNPLS